jgi:hypothetical protein
MEVKGKPFRAVEIVRIRRVHPEVAVRNHISNILARLRAEDRTPLADIARKQRLV